MAQVCISSSYINMQFRVYCSHALLGHLPIMLLLTQKNCDTSAGLL